MKYPNPESALRALLKAVEVTCDVHDLDPEDIDAGFDGGRPATLQEFIDAAEETLARD